MVSWSLPTVDKPVRRRRMQGPRFFEGKPLGRCFFCERKLWRTPGRRHAKRNPTLDHLVPLIRGGTHAEDNLRASCRECNWKRAQVEIALTSGKPVYADAIDQRFLPIVEETFIPYLMRYLERE